jgi:hypothetical protein
MVALAAVLALVFGGRPGARGSEAAAALLAALVVLFAERLFPRPPPPATIVVRTESASDDVRVIEGWFWFPPATDSSFGTLELRRRDLRLRLRDSLDTDMDGFVVIHGEGLSGEVITVLDAYVSHRQISSFGHNTADYRANGVVLGIHVLGAHELRFARARLHVRGLTEWLATPGPAADGQWQRGLAPLPPIEGDDSRIGRGLAWIRSRWRGDKSGGGERRELKTMIGDAELTLGFEHRREHDRYSQTTRQRGAATIELTAPIPLTEWIEAWIRPLTDLLVFATREQIVVESFVALLEDDRTSQIHPAIRRGLPDRVWNRVEVEVIRPQTVDIRPRGIEPFGHMLLPLGSLQPHAAQGISDFFSICRALGGAAGFLFGTLNTRSIYEENRLTNLTAFAEGYHRTFHDVKPLTDAEHDELVTAMLATVDKAHRRLYEAPLKYANSQSQRQRLRSLIERAAAVPALVDPRSRFCNEIIDTRNSYAHLGDDHPNALATDQLHGRVERLIQVIEFNLLLDLGLSDAHAARLLASAHQL